MCASSSSTWTSVTHDSWIAFTCAAVIFRRWVMDGGRIYGLSMSCFSLGEVIKNILLLLLSIFSFSTWVLNLFLIGGELGKVSINLSYGPCIHPRRPRRCKRLYLLTNNLIFMSSSSLSSPSTRMCLLPRRKK